MSLALKFSKIFRARKVRYIRSSVNFSLGSVRVLASSDLVTAVVVVTGISAKFFLH